MAEKLKSILKNNFVFFQRIENYVNQMLAFTDINSYANCLIYIDYFKTSKSKNCSFKFNNKCVNEQNYVQIYLEGIKNNKKFLDEKTIKLIENNLNIKIDDLETTLFSKCDASSSVDNNIQIDNFIFEECYSSSTSYSEFTNTGSAIANCVMTTLFNSLAEENPIEENKFNFNLLFICVMIIFVFLLLLISIFALKYKIEIKTAFVNHILL